MSVLESAPLVNTDGLLTLSVRFHQRAENLVDTVKYIEEQEVRWKNHHKYTTFGYTLLEPILHQMGVAIEKIPYAYGWLKDDEIKFNIIRNNEFGVVAEFKVRICYE
jgi:hypothetical protein